MLSVAMVTKPQGILGEVKLNCYLDTPTMLAGLTLVFIDNKPVEVEKVRIGGKDAFVKLKGVDDRDAAEGLRGKLLCLPRDAAPKLPDGRYYVDDVIGCTVWTDGDKELGKVTDILQNGSADVYVLSGQDGQIMFPALKAVLNLISVADKRIVVYQAEFEKVAVYED